MKYLSLFVLLLASTLMLKPVNGFAKDSTADCYFRLKDNRSDGSVRTSRRFKLGVIQAVESFTDCVEGLKGYYGSTWQEKIGGRTYTFNADVLEFRYIVDGTIIEGRVRPTKVTWEN